MELVPNTDRMTADEARAVLEAFALSCDKRGLLLERVKFERDEDGALQKVSLCYTETSTNQPISK